MLTIMCLLGIPYVPTYASVFILSFHCRSLLLFLIFLCLLACLAMPAYMHSCSKLLCRFSFFSTPAFKPASQLTLLILFTHPLIHPLSLQVVRTYLLVNALLLLKPPAKWNFANSANQMCNSKLKLLRTIKNRGGKHGLG